MRRHILNVFLYTNDNDETMRWGDVIRLTADRDTPWRLQYCHKQQRRLGEGEHRAGPETLHLYITIKKSMEFGDFVKDVVNN